LHISDFDSKIIIFDIIIREITDKIQQMALRWNYKTTANKTKGEEDSRQFVTLS
jgi:hypothetical protein